MYLSNESLQNLEQLLEFEFQAYPSHERDRIARISSLIDEQRQDREATSVVRQSNDPIRGDSLVAIDIRSHIPVTIKTIRFYDVPYFNSVLCLRLLIFIDHIGGGKIREEGDGHSKI